MDKRKIRKILHRTSLIMSFVDFFACYLLPLIEFKFFQHIDGKMITDNILAEEKCLKSIIDYAGISFFTSFLEYKIVCHFNNRFKLPVAIFMLMALCAYDWAFLCLIILQWPCRLTPSVVIFWICQLLHFVKKVIFSVILYIDSTTEPEPSIYDEEEDMSLQDLHLSQM